MRPVSPDPITLSIDDEAALQARVRAAKTSYRDRQRARIVLAAAAEATNAAIAVLVGMDLKTVRKWRRRFAAAGMSGITDMPRSGRPSRFTAAQVAETKALACELPAETADPVTGKVLPLSRWSINELTEQVIARGIAQEISASTVRRWLDTDAIKPWQHRSWIFPRDPDFAAKAARVLDLYARTWEGRLLGADEYVISADEKSQLQALRRRHHGQPPGPGRTRRIEFEYTRGGTLAYMAAYDVHHAKVFGQIAPKTGIEPFTDLVDHVMNQEPYKSATRVYWIVDNGSSHAGQASIDRIREAWPNATLIHTPVHASWLNQIEIYFSILQRKTITTGDFADLDHLAERILAFQDHYNQTANPFAWRYSRQDLNRHLARLNNDRTLHHAA
ncbi:IS630 family transposase [Nocardioides sp.]|uniref:IS630 family transposase n=1 Tax=Nocardioides sp. TaxID=35761 RepID=UPI0039E322F5